MGGGICRPSAFNRQGEFVNDVTGAVNYLGLAEIFLSWFLAVSCVWVSPS